MKSYIFRVVIEEDAFEDGRMAYHAYIPALRAKGGSTWGYTPEEALKNIREVAALVMESLHAHGEAIPLEPRDEVRVSDEPLVAVTLPS
jgi:predicted RNase H-like HicB family nuclease